MTYEENSPFAYPVVRWDGIGTKPQISETSGITRVRDSGKDDPTFERRPVGFTAQLGEREPLVWEGDGA